jgi:DNA-binding NarL/FixJ family response regulator
MGPFLIVDDHTVVREGLGRIFALEFPGSTIGYASTTQKAIAALGQEFWLLAVVDLSLPGGSGLDLIRKIKDSSPRTRILVHTMHSDDQFGVRALRAGADGFITKDAPVTEIVRAMHKILQGGRYVSPALAEILAWSLSTSFDRGVESLSDREFQILQSITAGKTLTEISTEMNLSIKTVSTYRARVLEKLNLRTTADLVRFGIEHLDTPRG